MLTNKILKEPFDQEWSQWAIHFFQFQNSGWDRAAHGVKIEKNCKRVGMLSIEKIILSV